MIMSLKQLWNNSETNQSCFSVLFQFYFTCKSRFRVKKPVGKFLTSTYWGGYERGGNVLDRIHQTRPVRTGCLSPTTRLHCSFPGENGFDGRVCAIYGRRYWIRDAGHVGPKNGTLLYFRVQFFFPLHRVNFLQSWLNLREAFCTLNVTYYLSGWWLKRIITIWCPSPPIDNIWAVMFVWR